MLQAALSAKGVSQNEAGPLLGISGPFVNQMINRTRRPSLDQVTRWARILGIEGDDRDRFIEAAHLAHATSLVRSLVTHLRELAIDQERRLAALEHRVFQPPDTHLPGLRVAEEALQYDLGVTPKRPSRKSRKGS